LNSALLEVSDTIYSLGGQLLTCLKKIAYGEQYWLKGVESKQPDGYFDWDVRHRKEHNLAEESLVFSNS